MKQVSRRIHEHGHTAVLIGYHSRAVQIDQAGNLGHAVLARDELLLLPLLERNGVPGHFLEEGTEVSLVQITADVNDENVFDLVLEFSVPSDEFRHEELRRGAPFPREQQSERSVALLQQLAELHWIESVVYEVVSQDVHQKIASRH